MPNHNWDCSPLLLRQPQDVCCEIAQSLAVEGHQIRYPEGVQNREQQQRVYGRLSERFGLLDQQTSLLCCRLGFRGGIAFDMDEWGDERDLKLDLLATPRGGAGQGGDLLEGAGELGRGFD